MSPRWSSPSGLVSWPTIRRVARREILVRVRSRVFATTTALLVILVVAGIVAYSALHPGSTSQAEPTHVGFAGASQALEGSFKSVAAALGQTITVTDLADASTGRSQVEDGTLDMAVSGSATAPTAVVGKNVPGMVEIALDAAAQDARLAAAGMTPQAISSVMAGVPFEPVERATSQSALPDQNVFGGLAVAILLFVSIEGYGNLVALGVVEEKATRIMEILLATIRPTELLAGKILGIGLVGLLQLGTVAAAALVTGSLTHALSIPALGVVEVAAFLAWFLLGFLLYASAFAAVAALVSRQEEAQSATLPITAVLVSSYILMFFALADPTSGWVTTLSIVPPAAPILMSMRIAEGAAAPWQVVLAMALTVAAIGAVVWLAGRVYAHAATHIGMRLPFREALRG